MSFTQRNESNFLQHGPCGECGSSDGVGWYDDGHGSCYVCKHHYSAGRNDMSQPQPQTNPSPKRVRPLTPVTTVFRDIPRRGLPLNAVKKYQIDVNTDKEVDVAHRYPYFKNGIHIANKVRRRETKDFYWEGDASDVEMFGQQLFPPSSAKGVTIVEGEIDAPSGWVLMGDRYPVVSVASAGSAIKDCRRNFEYLNSFDDVVICFDKDEAKHRPDGSTFYPGQEAAKKVAEMFTPGKARIMTLEHGKDCSEYLQNNVEHKTFVNEWWRAPKHMPDGLVFGPDLWEAINNSPKPFSVPYPFDGLNRKTFGLRLGEMVTVAADPKIGKTTILKTIEYCLLQNELLKEMKYGVGFMHLEETTKDLAVGLMGIHIGKRIHLPDVEVPEDELRKAYDDIINTSRVVVWDHFGGNSVEAVCNKVRHMAVLGCKYIILDHFSMLASDQTDDERKKLDEIATRLKTLTVELDICLIGVIHTNRQGQIRGTAGFEQLSNLVIRLERDKMDPDEWRRNVTVLSVSENRFTGDTGPACHLFFDGTTGRLVELPEDVCIKFDEGLSINDSDIPF